MPALPRSLVRCVSPRPEFSCGPKDDPSNCTFPEGTGLPQDQVAANRNWTFQINGKRVFAHGANWLPCDMRTSECTPEHYEYLIGSAADANMNFIRVWGVSNPAFFSSSGDPPLPPNCAVTTNCAVSLSHRAWFWFASVAHRSGADLSTRCDVILGSKLVCRAAASRRRRSTTPATGTESWCTNWLGRMGLKVDHF